MYLFVLLCIITTFAENADVMEISSEMVAAVGAIISAYFAYNQYSKNKMTDLKYEIMKKEEERRYYKRSEYSAKVFGELWRVLYELKADRVYIVQPHPLGHAAFLSVQFEVKRKGVEGMKESIQSLPMGEVAVFSKEMAENLFVYISDIDKQVSDKVAKSILSSNGCVNAIIKRLNNSTDWVGSIFCEFTTSMTVEEEVARHILHEAAINIQYNLPEYRENPLKLKV